MTSHADLTLDTSDVPPWHRVSTMGTVEVKPRTVVVESNVLAIVEHAGQTSEGQRLTVQGAGRVPSTGWCHVHLLVRTRNAEINAWRCPGLDGDGDRGEIITMGLTSDLRLRSTKTTLEALSAPAWAGCDPLSLPAVQGR